MMINGKEHDYVVHDANNVKGFFGEYRFLSNFHVCPVYFEGVCYPSTENAFMAAKTLDLEQRIAFETIEPKEAKALGRKIALRADWENVKYDVMAAVNFDKYYRNLDVREKLVATGDRLLEETNHWGDTTWGADPSGNGENNLGKILMNIRSFWQNHRNKRIYG